MIHCDVVVLCGVEWRDPSFGPLRLVPSMAAHLVSTDHGMFLNADIVFRLLHRESIADLWSAERTPRAI